MESSSTSDSWNGKDFAALLHGETFKAISTSISLGYTTNLGAVCLVNGEHKMMIMSNPRWYTSPRTIVVDKVSADLNDIPTGDPAAIEEVTKGEKVSKASFFSGFLGMIEFQEEKLLIFAGDATIQLIFENEPIVNSTTIVAVKARDGSVHEALSSKLTELVSDSGFFSFKKNITQRLTASNAKQRYNHQMFWAGACFMELPNKGSISKEWDLHFTLVTQINFRARLNSLS